MDGEHTNGNGETKAVLRAGIRWNKISAIMVSLICAGSSLWSIKILSNINSPVITLNPPITTLGDATGFNYYTRKWNPGDAYMTVAEALNEPQADGMTEERLRELIIAGCVKGPPNSPIRTMHGFYNDWIIPRGFSVHPPGTLLPANKINLPPNPP